MRPSLFLLPTLAVVALAVACQSGNEPAAPPAVVQPAAAPVASAASADTASGTAPQAFRATGNEPGWLAQVGTDGHVGLRVEVDHGQTTYDVAAPTQGADGWAGTATDGTPVKLSIERVPCQDTMSGDSFDAKAMLTVGARQLHGCGSFSAP